MEKIRLILQKGGCTVKCEDALLLISGHIDQENTPEEEAQLLQHLQQCPDCRKVLQAFEEMHSGLAALNEEPPADLRQNVMNVIRSEVPAPGKQSRRWMGLAVAAALALVIGAAAMPKWEPAPAEAEPAAMSRTAPAAEEVLSDAVTEAEPQALAESRQAAVVVTCELLPEMEVCPCETLESGELLYCLESASAAGTLSEQYGLPLYLPSEAAADASYALLLPAQ